VEHLIVSPSGAFHDDLSEYENLNEAAGIRGIHNLASSCIGRGKETVFVVWRKMGGGGHGDKAKFSLHESKVSRADSGMITINTHNRATSSNNYSRL
jgi:hypothetical protein